MRERRLRLITEEDLHKLLKRIGKISLIAYCVVGVVILHLDLLFDLTLP